MTDISRLKYIQWRPIGVCDTGVGKERKAKMFTRTDLAKVTSLEVNRENWRQQPEVLQLIQLYAHDLARISNLTDKIISPEIAEIKLVGAVLGHEQTPNLNQESADGRVQFFQLYFREGKTKKVSSKNLKINDMISLVVFLGMTSMFLIASRFSLLSLNSSKKSVSVCSTNRQEEKYSKHLRDLRKSLVFELNRLPAWSTFNVARTYCIGGKMSVKQQEQRLLQCLLKVRNRTKNMPPASRPSLNKIEACARTLCQKELPHLSASCKRL